MHACVMGRFVLRSVVAPALMATMLLAGWCAAGAAKAPALTLPPLAVADRADGWQAGRTGAGSMAGSLEVARRDFAKCLARQGWTARDGGWVLGRSPHRSMLQVWSLGEADISLLIWESEAGRCRFQWGMEDGARQRSKSQ